MENKKILRMKYGKANVAFTLIELLVVIAIIGVLAALIANLAKNAADKRKIKRVEVELAKLQTVIEDYESKRGSVPPDNGDLIKEDSSRPSAGINQLFYELAGTTYDEKTRTYTTLQGGREILADTVSTVFNRGGIANSRRGQDGDAKQYYAPKENELKVIKNNALVLVVPVDLNPGEINPWRYDASSTNRHNPDSYDLWAEILIGGKTNIIGNWNN